MFWVKITQMWGRLLKINLESYFNLLINNGFNR